jgi:putative glycosyltransferase (TIGR04372 family)
MKLGRWITRTRLTCTPPFLRSAQPLVEGGIHFVELADYHSATGCFLEAARMIPSWDEPCRLLGEVALRLRQPGAAVPWFEAGLARRPSNARSQLGLLEALLLSDSGRCASLLGLDPGRLPRIAPTALLPPDDFHEFPRPAQPPSPVCRQPGLPELPDVVRAAELRARQWSYDNEREAARRLWSPLLDWRRQQAAQLSGDRLHLDPEWISNIGNLGLIGIPVKLARLGLLQPPNLCLPPRTVGSLGNPALLECWERTLGPPAGLAAPESRARGVTWDALPLADGRVLTLFEEAAPLAERLWHERRLPPLLHASDDEANRGRRVLAELGLPRDTWFVTLHVRDRGFYGKRCDPGRWGDIRTYSSAIERVRSRGGWVIRLGDSSMIRAPRCDGLVDYAHSRLKSPWMDLFLLSHCRFFMGTNSGPAFVPPLFGVPCLYTNWFPFCLCPAYPGNLLLPKLYWLEARQRWLTFSEMSELPMRMSFHPDALRRVGLALRDNTPEELCTAVEQMLEPPDVEQSAVAERDALEARLSEQMRHHSWAWSLRLGRNFVRDHAALLDQPAQRFPAAH